MRFFSDEQVVYSRVTVPEHLCGWSNIVHGGVLTTILDEIMSWSAIYLLKRIALTHSINVEFVKPARVGHELRAEGRVKQTNGRYDAVTEGLLIDASGEVCARARATFKVFSPAVAKRLKIADEASIQWFEGIFNPDGRA
ncbi:MAG: PaaI family thioesterase [Desulfobacterales bacterium]